MSLGQNERWPGADVHYLVYESADFIVYIDSDIDMNWETSAKYDETGYKDQVLHNEILNRAALLESIPTYDLDPKIRLSYKRMLCEAVARSLCHDYVNADNILKSAELFVRARNEELARSWYLSAGCKTSIIFISLGILLWLNRVSVRGEIGDFPFLLAVGSIGGAAGALLSIIMRMGNANLDSSAGKGLHQLESMSRIFAGVISASAVILGVHADIIFPMFAKSAKQSAIMVLVGIVAGASERLAPSLIQSVEGKQQEKKPQPKKPAGGK